MQASKGTAIPRTWQDQVRSGLGRSYYRSHRSWLQAIEAEITASQIGSAAIAAIRGAATGIGASASPSQAGAKKAPTSGQSQADFTAMTLPPILAARRATIFATALAAIIGAMGVAIHAGQVAEPYWFATRGYTRDLLKAETGNVRQLANEQTKHIVSVQLRVAEGERRAIQSRIEQADVALKTLPPDASPSVRDIIKAQLETAQNQLKMVDIEIENLRKKNE